LLLLIAVTLLNFALKLITLTIDDVQIVIGKLAGMSRSLLNYVGPALPE
jgi:hypothetical protein